VVKSRTSASPVDFGLEFGVGCGAVILAGVTVCRAVVAAGA